MISLNDWLFKIKRLYIASALSTNNLIRNTYYLISDGIFTTLLGFIFWLLATRLYEPDDIGIGSVAISTITLLVALSAQGLGSGLIRFFPKQPEESDVFVNFILTLTIAISSLVLFIFYIMLPFWSDTMKELINENIFSFTIFTLLYSFTIIYDCVFIAKRKPQYLVVKNLVLNCIKIFLILFLTYFSLKNFNNIYFSWGLSVVVTCLVEIALIRKMNNSYYPKITYSKELGEYIFSYSIKTHIADIVSGFPTMILPMMILEMLDAKKAAYFSIVWLIVSCLMMFSKSVTLSLFSEASNNVNELEKMVNQAIKFVLIQTSPFIAIVVIFGKYILLVFGEEYSTNGYQLLIILSLTLVPLSLNTIYFTILRIEKKTSELLIYSLSMSISILLLSYILMLKLDFVGIGIAWIIPHTICTLIISLKLKPYMKRVHTVEDLKSEQL